MKWVFSQYNHLPGKWTIRTLSRPSAIFTGASEVAFFSNGPWISFKDSRGVTHVTSARVELTAEKS